MHCGIPNAYKFQLQELLHFLTYIRATYFDLIGHPQALQEHRFKRCLVFMHCGIPNAYKFQLQELLHFLIYVRATCFDLVGHPQALQEHRFKIARSAGAPVTETCKHLGTHNAGKLNNAWICVLEGPEDDLLGRNMSPWHISKSAGAPAIETCKYLESHNAEKLNNAWICVLEGPEDDLLGRNMSPWHIHYCIWNKCCVNDWRIIFICMIECHWRFREI